jgi:major membrane immunogen (membrane-anchored lipoprotein)
MRISSTAVTCGKIDTAKLTLIFATYRCESAKRKQHHDDYSLQIERKNSHIIIWTSTDLPDVEGDHQVLAFYLVIALKVDSVATNMLQTHFPA